MEDLVSIPGKSKDISFRYCVDIRTFPRGIKRETEQTSS
jgi:hypothetical protein